MFTKIAKYKFDCQNFSQYYNCKNFGTAKLLVVQKFVY